MIRSTHISLNIVFLETVELSYLNIHYRFHEPTAGSSSHPDDFSRQPDNVSVQNYYLYCPLYLIFGSRHNVVSIATCSEMDGQGFGPHGSEIFLDVSLSASRPPASHTMGIGSFPSVKRPERNVDHPPPSGVRVEYV